MPMMNTTGNSSPLALCIVISTTASSGSVPVIIERIDIGDQGQIRSRKPAAICPRSFLQNPASPTEIHRCSPAERSLPTFFPAAARRDIRVISNIFSVNSVTDK